MNASSYDIIINYDTSSLYVDRRWNKSDPVPDNIYDIRQSLVQNKIITNQEILKCSTEFIVKIERHLPIKSRPRRIKRSNHVNHSTIYN